jgi:hydrogenase maturation protease
MRVPHVRSRRQADRNGEGIVTPRILVAGIGNVLLQDDGFGPHAIAHLHSEYEFSDDVELLDLGTPGLDFVDYLAGRDVLILLDALATGGAPGEIRAFDSEQIRRQLPSLRLSAHQPCLQETLFTAETAGVSPGEILLIGVTGAGFDVSTSLSDKVAAAMPRVLELVADLARKHGAEVRRRTVPLPLNSWWSTATATR